MLRLPPHVFLEVTAWIGALFQTRGERVMIDIDLATLYGVETRVLVQA